MEIHTIRLQDVPGSYFLNTFSGDFQMILESKAWIPSDDNAPREFLSPWLARCGEKCRHGKISKNQHGS